MGKFLRENWLWLVMPIVIVVAGLAIVIATTGDDTAAPFDYNLGALTRDYLGAL